MAYDKVWIDETWRLIRECAEHKHCTQDKCATVVLSPYGCEALLEERKEMRDELSRLRAVVIESRMKQ